MKINKKLLIFLFAFLLYSGTFQHSYVLDDNDLILVNDLTHNGVDAIPTIFSTSYRASSDLVVDDLYRPLARALYAIEWEIWPNKPGPAHVINVLLYAYLCILVYQLLLYYLKESRIPFISALLFAALPIHVESVANIKSADELLALIFSLNSLIFIYKYFDKGKVLSLVISLVSFFVSLLAKESSVAFILIIPLSVYFFMQVPLKKNISVSLIFLVPLLTYLAIRFQVIGGFNANLENTSNYLVSIENLVSQKATAIMLLGYYLLIMLIPYRLMSDGSFDEFPVVGFFDWQFLLGAIALLGLFIYAVRNLKQRKPEAFFILFFFLTASLVSNIFFLIGTNYGERLMLSPSLGICTLVAIFIFRMFPEKKKAKNQRSDKKPIYVLSVILLLYVPVTFLRAADWKDEAILFSEDAEAAPNSARAQYYFGNQFAVKVALYGYSPGLQSEVTPAMEALRRAVDIRPDYHEAYYSIGEIYAGIGQSDSAAYYYKKSADLFPKNGRYLISYGAVVGGKGDIETARKYFRLAVTNDSTYRDAWLNLGMTYGQTAQQLLTQSQQAKEQSNQAESQRLSALMIAYSDTAVSCLNRVVTLDPTHAKAYEILSILYNDRNEKDKAKEYQDKAASVR